MSPRTSCSRPTQRLGQRGELNQRAWLYRVTLNACYDHLRARKRKPSVPLEPGFELDIPSTIDRCEQAELRRQLEEAFRRVPPAQRAALLLREIHGLHVHEVAFALGVKPASAEVTLVRARSSFRRHFAEISEPGVRWVAKGASDKRRAAKAAPRVGSHALVVGLPALALLKAAPLPACLDASSVLAAGSSAGIGGGVVAGAVAKIAAALTTKAAVVAIGATVVAGSAGGLYTVERASLVDAPPRRRGDDVFAGLSRRFSRRRCAARPSRGDGDPGFAGRSRLGAGPGRQPVRFAFRSAVAASDAARRGRERRIAEQHAFSVPDADRHGKRHSYSVLNAHRHGKCCALAVPDSLSGSGPHIVSSALSARVGLVRRGCPAHRRSRQ